MKARIWHAMAPMRAILAAALLMTGVASTAAGQTWSELQERGRHAEAAEALQALVLNALSSPDMFFPDVEATISLARLYAEGRGVEQDRVVGCSFAELAYHAAAFRHPDPQHPAVHRVELARAAACDDLAPDDRQEAVQMMACPVYGPELQSFALDAHHVADVSRRGIVIRQAGAEQVEPLPAFGCPRRLALARHTVVPDGRTSSRDRHFLEVFTWAPSADGRARQTLTWSLGEVLDGALKWHTMEPLGDRAGSPWSSEPLPVELTTVGFETVREGQVRWRFTGIELAGTIDPLPEPEASELPPALPSTGSARVVVTSRDVHGAPLPGASVRLSGMVSRDAAADEAGMVTFDYLPDGRYDVVVSAKGLASSAVQVFDLAGSTTRALDAWLKPHAATSAMTLACGGLDARNLAALASGAAAVVHVAVVDQNTVDDVNRNDSGVRLTTRTLVRVLRTFKALAFGPAAGSRVTVVQPGGRIDRGAEVQMHTFNRLAPLDVGDEYVLFLIVNADGAYSVHGSEEGAFRIRNGRVDPLGSAAAAETWKSRAAAGFLRALEQHVRD
jgi:hypothetical protein